MIFEWPDLKIRNPYFALALEDAIAEYCGLQKQEPKGFFRFWSNSYTIVLGRTCDARKNIQPDFLHDFQPTMNPLVWKHNPMIARRVSGGGTVVHGPGNVNFSFFLPISEYPDLYAVRHSYDVFLGMVVRSLQAQDVDCTMEGLSDIVMGPAQKQRKISGNAQFRKYGMIVHHGTLLLQKDIILLISKYLNHPPKEPDYRKNRSHDDFLIHLPDSFDLSSFYNSLLSHFKMFANQESGLCPAPVRHEIIQSAKIKAKQLYSKPSWIFEGHPTMQFVNTQEQKPSVVNGS